MGDTRIGDEHAGISAVNDQPPRKSFFIGRWQPLHEGHIRLIRTALDEGRKVVIGIMRTPISARNPLSVSERRRMVLEKFNDEWLSGDVEMIEMPWIDEVCYGRACGWRCRHIHLDAEAESINGTQERKKENVECQT